MATADSDGRSKPPLGLLDPYALWKVAEVLEFGAKKYGKYNYRGGVPFSKLYDAALRHIFSFINGADYDDESHLSNIAHAICMLMFLLRMQGDRPHLDDRYLAGITVEAERIASPRITKAREAPAIGHQPGRSDIEAGGNKNKEEPMSTPPRVWIAGEPTREEILSCMKKAERKDWWSD